MKLIKDLGMQYATENSKQKRRFGIYECEKCLIHFRAQTDNVQRQNQKGCKNCNNRNTNGGARNSHGECGTRLNKIWTGMKNRCNNERTPLYQNYGGRGMKVCDEWNQYMDFRDWAMSNGYSDELSIDRIDNDKGYEPSNCRWATRKVQARNTRRLKSNNTSGYRGVSLERRTGKWRADIRVDGKTVYLGQHEDKLASARAYDKYVLDNKLEHTINGV